MSNVLIVAEQKHGAVDTVHVFAAGRALARRTGGSLHVALLGACGSALARELAGDYTAIHLPDTELSRGRCLLRPAPS
jgi:hypothetical protein